jgi:hypothetical protein
MARNLTNLACTSLRTSVTFAISLPYPRLLVHTGILQLEKCSNRTFHGSAQKKRILGTSPWAEPTPAGKARAWISKQRICDPRQLYCGHTLFLALASPSTLPLPPPARVGLDGTKLPPSFTSPALTSCISSALRSCLHCVLPSLASESHWHHHICGCQSS